MTLPTAGPITLQEVGIEFNTNPDIDSCARAAGLVPNNFSLDTFYGLENLETAPPTIISEFFNPTGLAQDKAFPALMSLDGNYIFCTMENSTDGGVEVYQNNNGYITFLDRYEGTTGSYLGGRYNSSLDVSSDGYNVIVGAPFEGSDGTVKILQFDGTNLNLATTIDDSTTDTEYGSSVQISREGNITYITSQDSLYIGIYDAFDDSTFNVSSFPMPSSIAAAGRQLRVDKGTGGWAYVASPNADAPLNREGKAYLLAIDTDNLTASLSDTMTAPTPVIEGIFGSVFSASVDTIWFLAEHNEEFLLYKRTSTSMSFIAKVEYNSVTEAANPTSMTLSEDGKFICVIEDGISGDPDDGYQVYLIENRNGSFVQRSTQFIPAPNGGVDPIVFSSDSKFALVPYANRDGEDPIRLDMGGGTALLTNLDPSKVEITLAKTFDANPEVQESSYGRGGAFMSPDGVYFGVNSPDDNNVPNNFAHAEFFKNVNGFPNSLGKFTPTNWTNTYMTEGSPVMDEAGEFWLVTTSGLTGSLEGELTLYQKDVEDNFVEIHSSYKYTGTDNNSKFGIGQPCITRDGKYIIAASKDNEGTGYLIENTLGVLSDVTTFQPLDIASGDRFGENGFEASSDGQWIVGCSQGDDTNTGALYLFQNVNGVVTQKHKVVPSTAVSGDEVGEFGAAITPDGNWVVVGSEKANGIRGTGWLFKRVDDQLIEESIIINTTEQTSTSGFFGGRSSITDDGTKIYVPQYNFSDLLPSGGVCLVFDNKNGSVTFDTHIQPNGSTNGLFFSRYRMGISSDGQYLVSTQESDATVNDGGYGWLLTLQEAVQPLGNFEFAIEPDYTKTLNDFMIDGTGATLAWKFLQDRILVTDEFFTNLNARRNKITGSFVYDGAGADLTILTRPSGPTYTILAANLTGDPTVTLELDVVADTFVVTVTPLNGSPQVEINTTASDHVFNHMGSSTATMGIKFNEGGGLFTGSDSNVTFSGDIIT